MSSNSSCSARVSTSLDVEAICCASTMRHIFIEMSRDLDNCTGGIQVGNDTYKPFRRLNQFSRLFTGKCLVFAGKPFLGIVCCSSDNGIQRAEQPDKENSKIPFFFSR